MDGKNVNLLQSFMDSHSLAVCKIVSRVLTQKAIFMLFLEDIFSSTIRLIVHGVSLSTRHQSSIRRGSCSFA